MKLEKQELFKVFASALGVPLTKIDESLLYNSIPEWDSTAHLQLIMAIEKQFDIAIDAEDMLDMSSVAKAMTILKKYGLEWK